MHKLPGMSLPAAFENREKTSPNAGDSISIARLGELFGFSVAGFSSGYFSSSMGQPLVSPRGRISEGGCPCHCSFSANFECNLKHDFLFESLLSRSQVSNVMIPKLERYEKLALLCLSLGTDDSRVFNTFRSKLPLH